MSETIRNSNTAKDGEFDPITGETKTSNDLDELKSLLAGEDLLGKTGGHAGNMADRAATLSKLSKTDLISIIVEGFSVSEAGDKVTLNSLFGTPLQSHAGNQTIQRQVPPSQYRSIQIL